MTQSLRFKGGFTLVELLITLGIIALSLSLVIPTFSVLDKYSTERMARGVIQALMFSRSSAIQTQESVFICPSTNMQNCDRNWSGQLAVYKDLNGDKLLDEGDEVIQQFDLSSKHSHLKWRSFQNKRYLELLPTGMTNYQNGTFTVCPRDGDTHHAIPVILNVAGRPYFGNDRNKDGVREYSSGKPVSCT